MSESRYWRGVPLDKRAMWSRVFAQSREGIDLAAACPICGSPTLHHYYLVGKPLDRVIDAERFVADGARWEWCSTCATYDHSQALVPAWWSDPHLVINGVLTAEPDALERALRQ